MSEMTPERFRRIVESYGASPARWPEAEREAAQALAARDAATADRALREAARLDRLLAGRHVEPPSSALVGGILAGASARRSRRRWWSLMSRGGAFAGLGMAGALAGALAVAFVLPMATDLEDDDGTVLTAFDASSVAADEWGAEQ